MAGNIKYIEPAKAFKKVSRFIIDEKEIDPFTLGLYVKVISLGKNWQLSVAGLASFLKVTEEKIRKAFTTLENKGYLRRTRFQDDDGQFRGWVYEFSAAPFSNLDKAENSINPDVGEKPMSVFPEGRKQPMSGNGVGIIKENKPEKEDLMWKIKLKESSPPSFPYPKPFSLSDKECDMARNDPTNIVRIKRYHLHNNLMTIAGELEMGDDQVESFLDYWCSSNHDHPEMIRAEEDRYFNLRQRADSWMKREKNGNYTHHQSKFEQHVDTNKNFNKLVANIYGRNQNNTGTGNRADNTPDEQ